MITTANCILLKALTVTHVENMVKDECSYSTIIHAAPHSFCFTIFDTDTGNDVYTTGTLNIKAANQEVITDKLVEAVKECDKWL